MAPSASPKPAATAPPSIAYVYFEGHINQQSTGELLAAVTTFVSAGIERVVLGLKSGGGHTEPGMDLYERLIELPCKLDTHAIEEVGSMALSLFLAGEHRLIAPMTTIWTHPGVHRFAADELVALAELRRIVAELEASDERERSILTARAGISPQRAREIVEAHSVFGVEEAVAQGLAHEIKLFEIEPPDAPTVRLGPYTRV